MQVSSGYICPIVWCTEVEEHEHICCPDCGAMEFGNMLCCTCKGFWEEVIEAVEIQKFFTAIHSVFDTNVERVISHEQDVQDG